MACPQAVLGTGVATEAAAIACQAAVSRFGISRLVALVHPEHVASRKVAENVGMHEERRVLLEDDYPAVVYAAELRDSRVSLETQLLRGRPPQ
jgi:RimJ/RimL family protein N-acetyltransferase